VQDAAEDPDDEDAAAALRQQIKRTLRDDEELRAELTNLLSSTSGTMTVTASGERAIAAQTVNTAITGDNARLQP
jgi:hypothetical protein